MAKKKYTRGAEQPRPTMPDRQRAHDERSLAARFRLVSTRLSKPERARFMKLARDRGVSEELMQELLRHIRRKER